MPKRPNRANILGSTLTKREPTYVNRDALNGWPTPSNGALRHVLIILCQIPWPLVAHRYRALLNVVFCFPFDYIYHRKLNFWRCSYIFPTVPPTLGGDARRRFGRTHARGGQRCFMSQPEAHAQRNEDECDAEDYWPITRSHGLQRGSRKVPNEI